MKKILTALLISGLGAALVLSAACGDDDDDAEAANDTNDSQSDVDPGADVTEAPPLLYIESDGERLEGELGNYQWEGVVADAFAIITPTDTSQLSAGPITIATSDTPFDSGTLTVFAVGEGQIEPESVPDSSALRWAAFPEEGAAPPLTIEVGADGVADLSDLEPGTYLLSFFATWAEGFGEYGFYVEVA